MSGRIGYHSGIVKNGLVFYLDAARTISYPRTGTTWTDISPIISGNTTQTPNNGTLQTSPLFNIPDVHTFTFDGTDDYVSTTTNYGTNPLPAHTISVWFKTSIANGKKIIGFENSQTGIGSTTYDRHIYMGTDGKIYYGVYDQSLTFRLMSSLSTLNDNNWHNAVGICTGANLNYLYIDGISNSSINGNAYPIYTTSYIRLGSHTLGGGWTNSTSGYFTGNIAMALVYNRALSASEILQNYNAQKVRFGL